MQFDYTGWLCQFIGIPRFERGNNGFKGSRLTSLDISQKISYPHTLKTKYSEKDSNLQPAPSSIPVLQILEKGDALSKIELSEHKKDSSMSHTGTSKR